MEYIVIGAIALAIIGYLVYTIRSGAANVTSLENKNATLEENSKMAGERIDQMEKTALDKEYDLRKKEDAALPKPRTDHAHTRSTWLLPVNKDKGGSGPDDLN